MKKEILKLQIKNKIVYDAAIIACCFLIIIFLVPIFLG